MQINKIQANNYNIPSNPNFGHSFRVSISVKDPNGINQFVNPFENHALYKKLNSKIVNWLNEDYYTNLRNLYGIPRKVEKIKPETIKHREMAAELRQIDDDYARFNTVRSVYRRNNLAYIATGVDVPIIENLKGAKQIGVAKADAKWTYGNYHTEYVKALAKAVKNNTIDYVQNDNVLLHSPRNKEVMLKTVFKPVGKSKSGAENYELDSYEFHENYTKRTLAPINPNFLRFKHSNGMLEEIKKTVEYHINKMTGKRVHFPDINQILYPKIEYPVVPDKANVNNVTSFVRKEPQQLELDFQD